MNQSRDKHSADTFSTRARIDIQSLHLTNSSAKITKRCTSGRSIIVDREQQPPFGPRIFTRESQQFSFECGLIKIPLHKFELFSVTHSGPSYKRTHQHSDFIHLNASCWLNDANHISSDCLTPELSDAGGPARPHCRLTWPARVRSSDFVGQLLVHPSLFRRGAA